MSAYFKGDMATPINNWAEAGTQLDNLARAIEKDLVPILSFPEGAPYTIAREWACYIDHLGALFSGEVNHSQKRFCIYLDKVMSQVDAGYHDQKDILLNMFRHGTVHEFDPKVLVNLNKQRLGWAVYSTRGRNQNITLEDGRSFQVSHLKITPHPNLTEQYSLWVSTWCLVDDLIKSIDVFKTGMGNPNERIASWNKVALELVKPTPFDFKIP
ncbi:MAG: hypothetical protein C4555_01065 [Dehalococcoidia bacterium]|nr:MAG: hypothetical protein C4555_01065 [Dehalococcoidia bacterium]